VVSGGGDLSTPSGSAREVARRLAGSPQLSRRELELLPLYGPGSVYSEVQGRQPGDSTTPGDLAELVSSISSVGVLQPILVERLPDQALRLVAGERRLRAVRPAVGSFTAKQQGIVAALKAHQGLTADLPPRPSAAEVAAWSFGPGTSAALGGAHAKTLHAAPDGSLWLFKPDATGGARAEAEATASAVYHRVGIPSVGVYARSIGGKAGCVQPIVSGASNLAADPKSWSQADVDAMVRTHVAAWGVGDHDANHTNVLRTPSGGLLPVDAGQAFKFFGSDRLDVDYHPNGSYGAAPPVFHQAYKAAKAGGLAPGVRIRPEAALPAIKAFEAIPDSQYRAMLAGVATKGVAGGAAWVPAMRKAAQQRLGTKTVSDAQVAAEFVDHAVARKNGLRQAFAGFFASLGFDGATKLEKVA
jgi:hypothetical protein